MASAVKMPVVRIRMKSSIGGKHFKIYAIMIVSTLNLNIISYLALVKFSSTKKILSCNSHGNSYG